MSHECVKISGENLKCLKMQEQKKKSFELRKKKFYCVHNHFTKIPLF